MSDELFPAETVTVKSPRLRWMEKHDVKTNEYKQSTPTPWSAWSGNLMLAINRDMVYFGSTEDDAITAWAKANHVRLWNEESI